MKAVNRAVNETGLKNLSKAEVSTIALLDGVWKQFSSETPPNTTL